ncbi:hypothetical protein K461DRAFT_52175 [Myriangium duriaei CBS 260.36]|uniref:Uncharacterized protein n=1 Tax=Myriangium duriaei CBS 260.36 TaxID=1168546 RepID=A0A9P4MGA2_9PEZI|nr:hypothetical protein K461DRAFT_52175 [Myriangium duriaei CBS 260.36]
MSPTLHRGLSTQSRPLLGRLSELAWSFQKDKVPGELFPVAGTFLLSHCSGFLVPLRESLHLRITYQPKPPALPTSLLPFLRVLTFFILAVSKLLLLFVHWAVSFAEASPTDAQCCLLEPYCFVRQTTLNQLLLLHLSPRSQH